MSELLFLKFLKRHSLPCTIFEIKKAIAKYSNYPLIRNSICHLRPENVSYNTRLSGNEGQCFLHEGRNLIAFHLSLQCLSMLI